MDTTTTPTGGDAAIELPDLDFDGIEVMSIREAVAVPETGATSGSSSCASCSCCGSSSCCSSVVVA